MITIHLPRIPVLVSLLLLPVCACWSATLAKRDSKRDMEREARIEASLSKTHPELVDTLRAARVAYDAEDYSKAAELQQTIIAKAPEFDIAYRRFGACLVQQGNRAEGLKQIEHAVELNRSAENLSSLAYYTAFDPKTEQIDPAEKEKAFQLLLEARRLPDGENAGTLTTLAQLSLQLNRMETFKDAVGGLRKSDPENWGTHYFSAILAALESHWLLAEKEIRKAEALGLPHEAAEKFLSSGVRSRAIGWRLALYFGVAAALWAVGLVLLFLVGLALSKGTLRQAQAADPRVAISAGERRLRQFYRAVINVAGVYYYISLPVVFVMVIGLVAAALYGCLMIGRIPIKLMLILGLGALFTVIAMVKSLFVRIKDEDPGRPLLREEAEGLWQMTEEVAQAVDTRQIDEIRITPGTEVAVYERGTWREKLQNKAKRILILGTGVLNGFKQDDFRAVLAHEYGHFSNRDTAGGDIGLRVRNDMIKFYVAMCEAGQATFINIAFHFLRIYNFIFRRISHGATRLQEILADRVAAQCYGAMAFEGGLKHVIRRSIEFDAVANQEIKSGIEARRPLQNLYVLAAPISSEVSSEFIKSVNRPTTDDDTHPSPRDRFQLVAPLNTPTCAPREGEVWDLFAKREAITTEMMATLEQQVAQYRET